MDKSFRPILGAIAGVSILFLALFGVLTRGPNAHFLTDPAAAATPIPGVVTVDDICAATGGANTGGFVDVNVSAAATAQLIAPITGRAIHLCSFHLVASGVVTVSLMEGTGTNCGTGTVTFSGPENLIAGDVDNSPDDISAFTLGASQAVCINLTAPVQVGGYITYAY